MIKTTKHTVSKLFILSLIALMLSGTFNSSFAEDECGLIDNDDVGHTVVGFYADRNAEFFARQSALNRACDIAEENAEAALPACPAECMQDGKNEVSCDEDTADDENTTVLTSGNINKAGKKADWIRACVLESMFAYPSMTEDEAKEYCELEWEGKRKGFPYYIIVEAETTATATRYCMPVEKEDVGGDNVAGF